MRKWILDKRKKEKKQNYSYWNETYENDHETHLENNILWNVEPLLGNDREVSKYKITVAD
jgi:hypothetical protein